MQYRERDRIGAGAAVIAHPGDSRGNAGFYPLLLRWFGMLPFRQSLGRGSMLRKRMTRGWYQFLSYMDRRVHLRYMNYGYAPLDPAEPVVDLKPEDAKDRYFIQLYHRVAGAIDLRGKDVVEVGCGRGGGASFVAKYLRPKSLTGMDFADRAVAFCRRSYRADGLTFTVGDAERMPFADASFDVVLNVESSHCYPHMRRFVREAARVLRPGGALLFADMRHRETIDSVRDEFLEAGFEVVEDQEITPNVLRALELDDDRKRRLIRREVPMIFRPMFRCFAGMAGTESHQAFATGEWVYWRFVLRKPTA
ncbi:class I SAM-dependent methyltransferase [Tautonia plasticadhaerens]|uniref:Phthiotriol/phenolphthiotriol dimycocerosates methyltransferase n=1 Tax=Tautonia plasticadhaerens TaxID=2527974 RepID=A0A518H3P1_9BACT|nr:methyltransferase domain-containing protein [Tautonia plasticadhaerens]QDV35459.1 Phthiotriol/phenolphthiotriol dimycocerosates methyltransferase [Tautonia plasticadhaerens]